MSMSKRVINHMDTYDFIIIGSGVTGLASGMYAGRLGLKTLVIGKYSETEDSIGGVLTLTDTVENYPGFNHLTGRELSQKIHNHMMDYKEFVSLKEEKVEEIAHQTGTAEDENRCFVVKTETGAKYQGKALLFATGTRWKKLPMPGAKEFENRGVSYCALCDGPLFRGKVVGVVGGSDSAAKEALFIAKHASKVYIFNRGEKIHPEPVNLRLIDTNPKIEVLDKINVVRITGDKLVREVEFDREANDSKTMKIDGVFGAIGHIPLSDLAAKMGVELDEQKHIKINRNAETNVRGVYAAGDVVDTAFKQAIVGVAEGVIAAHTAFEFIQENAFVCPTDDPEF